jgi:hypothetical protein
MTNSTREELLLRRLEQMLKAAREEQYSQYWAFTRSARGVPVNPAVTTEVVWLEQQVAALSAWLSEVVPA